MFQCRFSEKIHLSLKIYVKVSDFILKVNFFSFQKVLVTYVTPLYAALVFTVEFFFTRS